jgi:hypothetical protein
MMILKAGKLSSSFEASWKSTVEQATWPNCGKGNDAAIQERNWLSIEISVTVPLKASLEIPEASSSTEQNAPRSLMVGYCSNYVGGISADEGS